MGALMYLLAMTPPPQHPRALAIAHSQVDDKDPIRFFITNDGEVIINPVIASTTKTPVYKREGCLSFADRAELEMVPRFGKITVTYQNLVTVDGNPEPKLSLPITETLSSHAAHVFSHEVGHLNGVNIYDEDYRPETCLFFNDGQEWSEQSITDLYKT